MGSGEDMYTTLPPHFLWRGFSRIWTHDLRSQSSNLPVVLRLTSKNNHPKQPPFPLNPKPKYFTINLRPCFLFKLLLSQPSISTYCRLFSTENKGHAYSVMLPSRQFPFEVQILLQSRVSNTLHYNGTITNINVLQVQTIPRKLNISRFVSNTVCYNHWLPINLNIVATR